MVDQQASMRQAAPSGRMARSSGYTLRDLLMLAFYSWRVIILAALIPLLIGIAAAVTTQKEYTASGLIMVLITREHSGTDQVTGEGPSVLSLEGLKLVQSETQIMESDSVLSEVVQSIGPELLYPRLGQRRLFGLISPIPPEERPRKAVEMFRKDLGAEVQDDSNVIRVSFRHPNPQIAAAAANAVIEAYRVRRKAVFDVVATQFLRNEMKRFTAELQGIDGQIRAIKAQYDVIDIDQDVILAANQADTLLQRTRHIQERRATVRREVEAGRARLAAQPETLFDFNEQTNIMSNDEDRNTLTKLLMDRDYMMKHYAPGYPPLAQLNEKIARIEAQIAEKRKPQFSTGRTVRNPVVDYVTTHLMELEIEDAALDDQIAELERQYGEAVKRVDALRDAQAALHELERTRKVMEQIYSEYAVRTEAARIDEEAQASQPTNIRVIETPSVPVTGTTLSWSFLAAGVLGSILFGAAGGFAANWNRQVFILPGEAERRLGLASLASFTLGKPRRGDRASESELSHLAAQIVDTQVDGRPISVFQLLAANANDGEADVAQGLADEFANRRGLRVLLVDLGEGQAVARSLGLRPVAAGSPSAEDVDGMTVVAVPAFPNLHAAVDAVSSPLFDMRTTLRRARELMENLRRQFDIVIVVPPPLTRSHVGQRSSALVDATVMVLKAEETRAPAALWSRDAVLDAGGDMLGFVMTGRRFHIPSRIYRWL